MANVADAKNDKKTAVAKQNNVTAKKPNLFKRIANWWKETKSELKKVTWPTVKQVVKNTIVVLIVVILSAVFIGAVDALFKFIVSLLI